MTKERIVAGLSILLGLYAGWKAFQYLSLLDVDGVAAYLVPRVVESVTGVIGGLLLFGRSWIGYLTVSIAWATAFAIGVPEVIEQSGPGIFMPMDFLVSIPVLVFLYRAIRDKHRREST